MRPKVEISTNEKQFVALQRVAMTLLPPTAEQLKRMNEAVPTDPVVRKRDVLAIREWLSKQPHLPNHIGILCYILID